MLAGLLIAAALGQVEMVLPRRADGAQAAVPGPAEALEAVLLDAETMEPEEAYFCQWLWLPPWQPAEEWIPAAHLSVMLAANHTSQHYFPVVLRSEAGIFLRYDLLGLSRDKKWAKYSALVFDSLGREEPFWHTPLSSFPQAEAKRANKARAPPVSAGWYSAEQAARIAALTGGRATPLLRADFAVRYLVSSTDRGAYLHLRGFSYRRWYENRRQGRRRKSDRELFLDLFGADPVLADRREGDQAAAVSFREPTSKPGIVSFVPTDIGRRGLAGLWITKDPSSADIATDKHPLFNLLDYKPFAEEHIAIRPDGLCDFALFDARGNVQAAAPIDGDNFVASDFRKPKPRVVGLHFGGTADTRLEPAVSCLRCHGPSDWLLPVRNDALELVKARLGDRRPDILDDLGENDPLRSVLRLQKFSANFDRHLSWGRETINEAVLKITRAPGKGDHPAAEHAASIVAIHDAYRYEAVTPEQAALELGYRVAPGRGAAFFRERLRGPPGAIENLHVLDFQRGASVSRDDFGRLYGDLYSRLRAAEERVP